MIGFTGKDWRQAVLKSATLGNEVTLVKGFVRSTFRCLEATILVSWKGGASSYSVSENFNVHVRSTQEIHASVEGR